jgi:hypothetical protein
MYNGLLFLMKYWEISVHLLSVQIFNYAVLCHKQIFVSYLVVFAKYYVHQMVRVKVVMAVDYPILCGPCTHMNILLHTDNKICNYLPFVIRLGLQVVSQSL